MSPSKQKVPVHEFNGHAGRTGPSASRKWKANHNFSPQQQKQSASVGLSKTTAASAPVQVLQLPQPVHSEAALLLPQACTRRGLPCSGMSMEMTIPLQRLSIPSRHWQQVQQSPCQKVKLISCPEGWEIHKQQPRAIAARNAPKEVAHVLGPGGQYYSVKKQSHLPHQAVLPVGSKS